MRNLFFVKRRLIIVLIVLMLNGLIQTVFTQEKDSDTNNWSVPYKQCWVIKDSVSKVASDNDLELYTVFSDGKLRKINSIDSKTIWETSFGDNLRSEISLEPEYLYVSTNSKGKSNSTNETIINKISKITGITNSRVSFNNKNYTFLKEFGNNVLFGDVENKKIILFSKKKESVQWFKLFSRNSSIEPLIFGNNILLVSKDNVLTLYNSVNGNIVFQKKFSTGINKLHIYKNNFLYIGDTLGNLFSLDANGLSLERKLRTGGKITNIVDTPENILITSNDNFTYLISNDKGSIKWKKRLPGRIIVRPIVNKDVAIIFTVGTSKGFILDLENGNIINQIDSSENNFVVGDPIFQDTSVIVPYSDGLYKFSSKSCK